MTSEQDPDTISHAVRGIRTRGLPNPTTGGGWENPRRRFPENDEWTHVAAPFVGCARMTGIT